MRIRINFSFVLYFLLFGIFGCNELPKSNENEPNNSPSIAPLGNVILQFKFDNTIIEDSSRYWNLQEEGYNYSIIDGIINDELIQVILNQFFFNRPDGNEGLYAFILYCRVPAKDTIQFSLDEDFAGIGVYSISNSKLKHTLYKRKNREYLEIPAYSKNVIGITSNDLVKYLNEDILPGNVGKSVIIVYSKASKIFEF
jgi:hypothetical protein